MAVVGRPPETSVRRSGGSVCFPSSFASCLNSPVLVWRAHFCPRTVLTLQGGWLVPPGFYPIPPGPPGPQAPPPWSQLPPKGAGLESGSSLHPDSILPEPHGGRRRPCGSFTCSPPSCGTEFPVPENESPGVLRVASNLTAAPLPISEKVGRLLLASSGLRVKVGQRNKKPSSSARLACLLDNYIISPCFPDSPQLPNLSSEL